MGFGKWITSLSFFKDMQLTSTCVAILLTISRQEVLNFHISGFIRHKKALETGKCSVV